MCARTKYVVSPVSVLFDVFNVWGAHFFKVNNLCLLNRQSVEVNTASTNKTNVTRISDNFITQRMSSK
jgi:hypothetical protein